jgi:Uma2 family endonuclease
MMSAPAEQWISPEEYLVLERASEYRSEYFNGRIYAMAGATLEHTRITLNVGGELRQRLKGHRCEVLTESMRVKVSRNGLYTYPDVVVVCGPQLEDDKFDTLLNPEILIEVLFESTERYDRGAKFIYYQDIVSLKEYVLISQERPLVERFVRQGEQWIYSKTTAMDGSVLFEAIGVSVPMAEIYERIEFPDRTPGAGNEA